MSLCEGPTGLNWRAAMLISDVLKENGPAEKVLMLGRSHLNIRPRHVVWVNKHFATQGYDTKVEQCTQEDGFSERLLTNLGCREIKSMDFSAYEGAEYVHDLSDPVPTNLHEKFDLIYDGGTTEHIFDIPSVFRNIYDMLKPGGVFVSSVPGNNYYAHGLYQFGHDIVYTYWRNGCEMDVLRCENVGNDRARPLNPPC